MIKHSAAAAAAAAIFVLVGCGGGSGGSSGTTAGGQTKSLANVLPQGSLVVETQALSDLRTMEIFPDPPIFGMYGTVLRRVSLVPAPGRLAFCWSVGWVTQIFTSEPDGSRAAQMTRASADSERPRFSDDGTRLAYGRDGKLWVMNVNGLHERLVVLVDLTKVGHPAWVGDDELVVKAERAGQMDLYRVKEDGGWTTQLTNDAAREIDPDVSPNHAWIVYAKDGCTWELRVMRSNGTGDRLLVSRSGDCVKPRWAPDGSAIVFASKTGSNWDIWKVLPDGSELERLTTDPALDSYPIWSPDSQKILWVRNNSELWEMNADGTGKRALRDMTGGALDWWGPADEVPRTFIGPAGSDFGGNNPPFGSARYFVILVGAEHGTSAVSASVGCGANGSNVELRRPTSDMYVHTPVVELRAPCINTVYEDNGPGIQATTYDMPETDGHKPGAVLLGFNEDSGKLFAVLPIGVEVTSTSAGGEDVNVDRDGSRLVLRANFLGAFGPEDPARNLAPQGAHTVVIDADRGEIVAVE